MDGETKFQKYQNRSLKKNAITSNFQKIPKASQSSFYRKIPKIHTAPATGATEVFLNAAAVTPKAATPLGRFLRWVGYDVIDLL